MEIIGAATKYPIIIGPRWELRVRDLALTLQLILNIFLSVACLKPDLLSANERPPTKLFALGVQTHFSQGWDIEYQDLMHDLSTIDFRDELHWEEIETIPGEYDVSQFSTYLAKAEESGLNPLVLFIGTNDNYDNGNTPYTEKGRAAFARYVVAAIQTYPTLINRIEIGNEYNSDFAVGPFQEKSGYNMGQLIKAVAPAVRSANPDIEILCTGAHSVATGYLRNVFETGALDYCDAVSFHPYRSHPEHVDFEIRQLKALMNEFGGEKPLYATEFGNWFESPDDAPDYMLKMVTLMGSVSVSGAYWYALLNEEWWPNMGLYKVNREEMPAASAFRFLQQELLPLGRPAERGKGGEDLLFEFGEGGQAFIAWGASPAKLRIDGEAQYFDTSGNQINPRLDLSTHPVVVMGDGIQVEIVRDQPVHSAFFGYGAPPWSYHARKPDGEEVPFQVMHWNWGPYHGAPYHNPMSVTSTTIEAAMFDDQPYYSVERFTAKESGLYDITGRWVNEYEAGADGADVQISVNDDIVVAGVVSGTAFEWSAKIALNSGDRLDFAVGPNTNPGLDWVEREITILGP